MGTSSAKKIIFVCVGNSCRSQMAEGFAKYYSQKMGLNLEVKSGGTRPEGYVSPHAITVMAEKKIDISKQRSKGINPPDLLGFDFVISMGCSDQDVCPVSFRGVSEDWAIEDPFGKPLDDFRKARDEIERRVTDLLNKMS